MKRRGGNSRNPSEHMFTLHQRLYQALNLGIKYHDNEGKKWKSTDIETHRLAARAISAFMGSVVPDTRKHPLVKDSISDIVLALIGITQSRNEVVLGLAAEVTVTFVGVLGNSIPFHQLLKLVQSFSCLLSFYQSSVASSCASALNLILSKLAPRTFKSHNEVWDILNESKAIDFISSSLLDFINGNRPYECFHAMASLLRTILMRWSPSRYPVCNNVNLMEGLGGICVKSDASAEIVVLQLFSAIALCGSGADKLLQNGETFLSIILRCMDSSQPLSVRVEALKVTESLVKSEKGWLRIAQMRCESIVKAIVDAMTPTNSSSVKIASDQVSLVAEACKLALITRWAGEHHIYFWKFGIDKILLDLLIENFHKTKHSPNFMSLRKLIDTARKGLDTNHISVLRPYVWPILGWLATHCPEDFTPNTHGNHSLDVLITCGCLMLMDTLHNGRQSFQEVFFTSKLEPASRVVLLMVHSPCKYFASQARDILSKLSSHKMEVYLEYVLGSINTSQIGANFSVVNKDQTVIDLIIMSCLSVLPKYRSFIVRSDGIKILSMFSKWCLSSYSAAATCLQSASSRSTCCQHDAEHWEGGDTLVFFGLWALIELIQDSIYVTNLDEVSGGSSVQTLVDNLQEICGSPGVKWCAAYILSFFGSYGFPNRFGKRIRKALDENEVADIHLRLHSGECLKVHSVILKVRCPSMLPSNDETCRKCPREVSLSARVEYTALLKLLEFVYTGYVQVDDDLVKQVKLLARGSDLHSLSHMLTRKRPKWGTKVPLCDFTPALGPSGDIVLEAKADEVDDWKCTYCSSTSPHIHVHKIILWLSCDYFKALLQSGMQESHSQNIKVPVSWKALSKLVHWFYSDTLPEPSSGCVWTNMGVNQQLEEVHPYVELCWLAEFWLLEDFREDALRVVVSCLKSSSKLAFKIIKIAFELSQWEIVEVSANCLAPSYPHLRDSGDLALLDEGLVDMIRVAYVRLSQAGDFDSSD
ncbi:hypothetical protein ACHQM5_028456 [Ranunculus cassubicifolius]